MLMAIADGQANSETELRRMLQKGGLVDVIRLRPVGGPSGVLVDVVD
jgi:hypothetical protein